MEEKDMLKRFVVRPSIKLFGGIVVEEDTDLDVVNNDGTVHQKIKDLKLITNIDREFKDEFDSREISTMRQKLEPGTILIWGEDTGYIIPNYVMMTVADALDTLSILKGVVEDDTRNNEEEGSKIN